MNLNCLSEDFHSAGLQRISFFTSRVKMSPRVLNSFCVPAVFFFISAKWTKVSARSLVEKKHVSFARLACLYVLVCVVVLQNETFEGKNRRRPSAGNSNRFSKEKDFLRSLGLLGNESQLLKWRLSLCRSSENILFHLKGENVPKSTEQFLCASSFFLHFSEMDKSFSPKPCWKKTCEFCQVGLFVCPCVCRCASKRDLRRQKSEKAIGGEQ